MVREILTSAGVEVLTARDGREALEVVERRQDAGGLDLILMDLQMPVMDGFAATQRIRETHPAQTLPIMALSAHATTRETERCIAAGMNGHLSKPVDVALMFETLARFRGPGDIWWSAGTPATGEGEGETEDREPGSPAPLLDTGDGIRRVLGNQTLYRKMLAAFLRDQGDWMATLRALLAEHRDRDALDHLHALKGVTSNLSARRLLATLRSVEARFLEGVPPTAKTLDDLEATLGATLAAIAKGLETMDGRPDEPPLAAGDAAPLNTAEREAFLAMLRGKELGARRFLTHHRARLRATWPTADWNALEVAMESLHFEDATRILEGTLP
jgi:CheY-like chemotaxis protein